MLTHPISCSQQMTQKKPASSSDATHTCTFVDLAERDNDNNNNTFTRERIDSLHKWPYIARISIVTSVASIYE